MSGRLRDREVESLIQGELDREGAKLVGYEHKGSGNREVRFKVLGRVGRYVFPSNPKSCSRAQQNMIHTLRRIIRELREKARRKTDRSSAG